MSKIAGWQLTVYGRLINNQIILLFNTFISELCVSVGCWCSGSGVPHHTLHSAGCLPELQPRTFGHWRSEQPSDLEGPLSPPHPDPPLWTSCRPGLNRWLPLLTDLRNQRKKPNTRALPRVHMCRGVCVCFTLLNVKQDESSKSDLHDCFSMACCWHCTHPVVGVTSTTWHTYTPIHTHTNISVNTPPRLVEVS